MKKAFSIFLAVLMLAALCACGSSNTTPVPTAVPATAAPTAEPTAATDVPDATAEPVQEVPADTAAETVEKILSMKDQPVEDLYALVGEPLSSEYGSSCLVMGGKDGILEYDGFTVYTLVQPDGTETIYDCE